MRFECGCGYKTDDSHGWGGHCAGSRHKEWADRQAGFPRVASDAPKQTRRYKRTLPVEDPVPMGGLVGMPATGEGLLDAFLGRLERFKQERDAAWTLIAELKGFRTECIELKAKLKKVEEEKERILRDRNQQTLDENKRERVKNILS